MNPTYLIDRKALGNLAKAPFNQQRRDALGAMYRVKHHVFEHEQLPQRTWLWIKHVTHNNLSNWSSDLWGTVQNDALSGCLLYALEYDLTPEAKALVPVANVERLTRNLVDYLPYEQGIYFGNHTGKELLVKLWHLLPPTQMLQMVERYQYSLAKYEAGLAEQLKQLAVRKTMEREIPLVNLEASRSSHKVRL